MEDLLKQSLGEYDLILLKIQEIEVLLKKLDSEAISSHASALESLLSDAQKTDTAINRELSRHPAIQTHPVFLHRTGVIEQILRKISEISPKIQGIIAVHKTEFQKMRIGMKSMTGYSQEKEMTGNLFSSKC